VDKPALGRHNGPEMHSAVRHASACLSTLLALAVTVLQGQGIPPVVQDQTLFTMADEVAADVEKLRGWTFKRPVQRARATASEARRFLERQIDTSLPPPRRTVVEAFLRTAGLIPTDCNLRDSLAGVLEQQVAGYYDPSSSTLYLVEREGGLPAFMQRTILAHELTHALDDQYAGLRAATVPDPASSEDADLVQGALMEGSATALMLQYLVQQTTAGRVNTMEAAGYFAREMERAKSLERAPRYFGAMFGSYMVGAAFLAKGDLNTLLTRPDDRAIGESFLAAWKALPRSSEQLLHPAKYWDAAHADEPVMVDEASVGGWLAKPGREVAHRNTLGEFLTALLTDTRAGAAPEKLMAADGWTNAAASGWGGDRFFLLAPTGWPASTRAGSREVVQGVWVTAWDTPADRDEFVAALGAAAAVPNAATVAAGRRAAVVFIGIDAGERGRLAATMGASLKFTQAGRPWPF
jgi:hypothetical protein